MGLYVFFAILVVVPVWKILGRMGFNSLWALISIIPLANVIGLWLLAFTPWPSGGKPPNA